MAFTGGPRGWGVSLYHEPARGGDFAGSSVSIGAACGSRRRWPAGPHRLHIAGFGLFHAAEGGCLVPMQPSRRGPMIVIRLVVLADHRATPQPWFRPPPGSSRRGPPATACGAAGAQPTLLGQYGDWGAYTASPSGDKVCFCALQAEDPRRPSRPAASATRPTCSSPPAGGEREERGVGDHRLSVQVTSTRPPRSAPPSSRCTPRTTAPGSRTPPRKRA